MVLSNNNYDGKYLIFTVWLRILDTGLYALHTYLTSHPNGVDTIIIIPILQRRILRKERIYNLSIVTQPVCGRARIWTQSRDCLQIPCSLTTAVHCYPTVFCSLWPFIIFLYMSWNFNLWLCLKYRMKGYFIFLMCFKIYKMLLYSLSHCIVKAILEVTVDIIIIFYKGKQRQRK